jgi:hypothetical protein
LKNHLLEKVHIRYPHHLVSTKRNETKRNETKRNETKRNETKRNETNTADSRIGIARMEYIHKMLSEQTEERNRDLQRASLNAVAAIPP